MPKEIQPYAYQCDCGYLASAYREHESAEAITVAGQTQILRWDYELASHIFGLRIIEMYSGQEIRKTQVTAELGYTGERAWEQNKPAIMALLGSFFEEGSTRQVLRRRAVPVSTGPQS